MKIFTFCTCCEYNCNFYLERVRKWRKMLSPLEDKCDFFCIVDGFVPKSWFPDGVKPVYLTPFIGRKTIEDFPGWKRSYVFAMRFANNLGYDNIFHCENDVVINNFEKVKEYLNKPGLYSSIDKKYNFIEAAFQIINDFAGMYHLLDYYDKNGISDPKVFEAVLQEKVKFDMVFNSIRREGSDDDTSKFDFVAQAY